jgi:hypothetical protein
MVLTQWQVFLGYFIIAMVSKSPSIVRNREGRVGEVVSDFRKGTKGKEF